MSSSISFAAALICTTIMIIITEGIVCADDQCRQWVTGKRRLIAMGEVSDGRLLLLDDHHTGFLLPASALVNTGADMFSSGAPPPFVNFAEAEAFQLSGSSTLPPRANPTGAVLFLNEQHPNYYLRSCVGLLSEDGQSFALIPVEGNSGSDSTATYYPIIEDSIKLVSRIFISIPQHDSSRLILSALYNGIHRQKFKLKLTFNDKLQ